MRVFYAIEFSDSVKEYIKSVQNVIRENSIKGNFSHEENFHLTLKFIGEVDEKKLSKLKYSLDKVSGQVKPFSIRFDQLGFFNKENKKVVWIGVENEDKGLIQLYNTLETVLHAEDFAKELRGYSPHITLSRETVLKDGFEKQTAGAVIDPMEINVNRISLMESTRINGKLTYRSIYTREI